MAGMYRPFTPKCVRIIQEKLGVELTDEQIKRGKVSFIKESRWSFRGKGMVTIYRCDMMCGPSNGIGVNVKQPWYDTMTVEELMAEPGMGMTVMAKRGTIQNMARLLDEILNW